MTKADLRMAMRTRVQSLSDAERTHKSSQASRALQSVPQFATAQTIMAFISMPDEIDTTPLLHDLLARNTVIAIPRIDWAARTMTPIRIQSLDHDIEQDARGIPAPIRAHEVAISRLDWIIIPGLAFDSQGGRLGRGAGFYDRFLATPALRAVQCGYAYEFQRVPLVPTDPHDARMNWLATDAGATHCGANP